MVSINITNVKAQVVDSAQVLSDSVKTLADLSIEELLNLEVTVASKKPEKVFDAPLSVTVLTRDEIMKAGCTNIQEAFRLVPGMIVRESTNGNYDIHLRGLDNVPPGYNLNTFMNTTTLVMIDNRPVYNYFFGGTIWQSFTVDLNDIEKIEVVRGACSALYGPNAASGVINIITRRTSENGFYAVANSMTGTHNTSIINGSAGYQWKDKFSIIVSGNHQYRERGQDTYYSNTLGQYVPLDSISTTNAGYPFDKSNYPSNRKLSADLYGINFFSEYRFKENKNIRISSGYQKSDFHYPGYDATIITPIMTSKPQTFYLDGSVKWKNLSTYLSLRDGNTRVDTYHFKFTNIDAVAEYDINIKKLNIKPGINFRNAMHGNFSNGYPFFEGSKTLRTMAGFVKFDLKLLKDKLRLISGLRLDKFNFPTKSYFSFQNVATYSIKDNFFRLVYSRAYRAPFLVDLYTNLFTPVGLVGPGTYLNFNYLGNKEIKLLKSDLLEFGYRVKLNDNTQLDLEIFNNRVSDFSAIVRGEPVVVQADSSGTYLTAPLNTQNIKVKSNQTGATFGINIVYGKFQIRPFVTYQHTKISNYSPYTASPDVNPVKNINFDSSLVHKGTPDLYGGGFFNYKISDKWNLNFNPYFYTSHTFYHSDFFTFNDGVRGKDKINAKLLLNAKLSYHPVSNTSVFISVRNLLNDKSVEFYKSDNIGISVYGGISFQY